MKRALWAYLVLAPWACAVHAETRADSLAVARPQRPRIYAASSLGYYDPPGNAGQLEGGRASFAISVRLGYEIRPTLALEGELASLYARYNAPPLTPPPNGSYSNDMSFSSTGVVFSARLFRPMKRFEPYGRAGVGLYGSKMKVDGTITPSCTLLLIDCFLTVQNDLHEEDLTLGFHVAAGADLVLDKQATWSLGLEARQQWLSADFDQLSAGEVNVGGQIYTLSLIRRSRSWWRWL